MDWAALLSAAAKPAIVAALVASLAMSVPGEALAARSGGRMGGSSGFSSSRSFSSGGGGGSSSFRSSGGSSAPSSSLRSYGPSYSSSFFYPAPMIGGPMIYGAGPGVYVSTGPSFFTVLFNIVVIAFIAYVAFQLINGAREGGGEGGVSFGGDNVAVGRLQLALLGSARELQSDLEVTEGEGGGWL